MIRRWPVASQKCIVHWLPIRFDFSTLVNYLLLESNHYFVAKQTILHRTVILRYVCVYNGLWNPIVFVGKYSNNRICVRRARVRWIQRGSHMDQHRNEHRHRNTNNDSAVLSGSTTVQEETRNNRPYITHRVWILYIFFFFFTIISRVV